MARTWLINGRGIAGKVKNATRFTNCQIKDLGIEAHRECPNCKHLIDNSDVSLEWPGLPAGVKFDPTDIELLEHLAGKVGLPNSKTHMFIDEFIPTIEEDQGICYTHPENLPGVKKDGSSIHFFHRISNAYATGRRKRRRINGECNTMSEERVRWHKTGKTKPVIENGIHKGWKKIMVLYRSLKKESKPHRVNWVMHQYHLGVDEDEKDGELVVSKISYQQNVKQADKIDAEQLNEDSDILAVATAPRTPKTVLPQPPRPENQSPLSEAHEYNPPVFSIQSQLHQEPNREVKATQSIVRREDDGIESPWLAGESQAIVEFNRNTMAESLLCHEVLDNFVHVQDTSVLDKNINSVGIFSDLDNIHIDTPPDFHLADLQFGSQDSISSWLDRL